MQHQNNNIAYKRFENVFLHGAKHTAINKSFRYVDSGMKSYEQEKKGLSYVYHNREVTMNKYHNENINTVRCRDDNNDGFNSLRSSAL